jgi:mono/diheme cytochrome c family protein
MFDGQTSPLESNGDDPKMSDPSTSPPASSAAQLESSEDEPAASPPSLMVALILGFFKIAAAGLLVYLTYFFTMTFASRTPPPPALSEDQVKLARKTEELRSQGKTLLSSYGWVNPASKSNVHIPIERAMELLVAEAAQPPPPAQVAVLPAGPGTTPSPAAAIRTAAAGGTAGTTAHTVAAPAPPGMPPEEIYRAVCMACHEADGRGKIYRMLVPTIPDLTDAQWHTKRTDAELQHSILEGKESIVKGVKSTIMLPQKDNLARARIEVKDMVAFMRAFKGGKQVVSATPGAAPAAGVPVQVAETPASAVPVPTTPPAPAGVAQPAAGAGTASTSSPAATKPGSTTPPVVAAAPTSAPAPPTSAPVAGGGVPRAIPATAVSNAAQEEKIRAAGITFNTLCIVCHGQDGRGMAAVRTLAPTLPDFTSHDWHSTKSNSQLATTIMEGKGTMPAWNTQLTADRARDLALYLRKFGAPEMLAEAAPAATPSTAEFDKEMSSLRQKFDEIEKQLQALATTSPRP